MKLSTIRIILSLLVSTDTWKRIIGGYEIMYGFWILFTSALWLQNRLCKIVWLLCGFYVARALSGCVLNERTKQKIYWETSQICSKHKSLVPVSLFRTQFIFVHCKKNSAYCNSMCSEVDHILGENLFFLFFPIIYLCARVAHAENKCRGTWGCQHQFQVSGYS